MRNLLCVLLGLFAALPTLHAQSSDNTLDVVSWNIEWFGASSGPADNDLQERNVVKVLRYLSADIYGLVEVVDTARLRRVTDSLGSNWAYVISNYASANSTGTGSSWLSAQKLAYIYNKNIFSNVKARGMMRTSGPAYTAFASGRFPFLLTADATINGITRNINFILIHGKAGSSESDYTRRLEGAKELKDSLDTYHSTAVNLLIGDFNDALNTTICSSCGTNLSSFDPIIKDSTDSDHYRSITLPLGASGQSSMISYPNVVDNHVVSNEAFEMYVANSARVRTDVTTPVPDYTTGNTSDHYPVFSQYILISVVTSVPTVPSQDMKVSVYPNPFADRVYLSVGKLLKDVNIQLTDITGKIIFANYYAHLPAQSTSQLPLQKLSSGIYYIRIQTPQHQTIIKLVRQ